MNTTYGFSKSQGKFGGVLLLAAILTVCLLPLMADATGVTVGTGGTAGLTAPWDEPMSALAGSFTGPVAMALALIMIVVGVGTLMFGGDLAGWARWVAFALVAAGTLGSAGTIVNVLGLTGAIV